MPRSELNPSDVHLTAFFDFEPGCLQLMSVISVWRPGRVYLPKSGVWHCGVLILDESVIHFKAGGGKKSRIEHTSYLAFTTGDNPSSVYAVPIDKISCEDLVGRRAAQQLCKQTEYNCFTMNCESFERYCTTGVKHSKQVAARFQYVGFFLLGLRWRCRRVIFPSLSSGMVASFGVQFLRNNRWDRIGWQELFEPPRGRVYSYIGYTPPPEVTSIVC